MKTNPLRNCLLALAALAFLSCKKEKDAELPELSFKSGSQYLSGNADATQGTVYTVGVVAEKAKRDLRRFEVNYRYDNGDFKQSESVLVGASEKSLFERDVTITTRNEPGRETWQFEISDIDGNTAVKSIQLDVQ
jgi:hypothetical protein